MPTFDESAPLYQRLTSGAQLALLPLPWARTVSVGAWLRTGSRDEDPARNGIAHLLEHMVFKGTAAWDTYALAREFETLGGTMDAYTTPESTVFTLHLLPEHLRRGLDLLAEMLIRAELDAEHLALEKQVVGEEIEESEDSPSDIVAELTSTQAWGEHALGRPVLGTAASLAGIDRDMLVAWRGAQYAGDRLLLAIAGAVEADATVASVEAAFADWSPQAAPLDRPTPTFSPGLVVRRVPNDQVYLCVAVEAPSAVAPKHHAAWVVDMLLGATMSSRLFQGVRERRGLAYQISSTWQPQADTGLLTIDAVTTPGKVAELLTVVRAEAEAMVAEPPSAVDLAWVKDYARTTLRLGTDSTTARMARMARGWFYDGRWVPLTETLDKIEALTAEDVQQAAARLFGAARWVTAAVGPVTERRAARWAEVMG